jgi:putative FmdB family regulatory protein
MPIYEYICSTCSVKFEELVLGRDNKVSCPDCDSKAVKKVLSSFAAISLTNESNPTCATPACGFNVGSCGSGRCGSN